MDSLEVRKRLAEVHEAIAALKTESALLDRTLDGHASNIHKGQRSFRTAKANFNKTYQTYVPVFRLAEDVMNCVTGLQKFATEVGDKYDDLQGDVEGRLIPAFANYRAKMDKFLKTAEGWSGALTAALDTMEAERRALEDDLLNALTADDESRKRLIEERAKALPPGRQLGPQPSSTSHGGGGRGGGESKEEAAK